MWHLWHWARCDTTPARSAWTQDTLKWPNPTSLGMGG